MIRTYLEFDIMPGCADRFVQFFHENHILDKAVAQDGCESAELTISEDGLSAIVTATWKTMDDYRTWTNRSDRDALASEIAEFLVMQHTGERVGRQYEIRLVGGQGGAP